MASPAPVSVQPGGAGTLPAAPMGDLTPPAPPVQEARRTLSPMEAAIKIQLWYRSQRRRIRFLKMVRRALRRRKYLDERRSLAQRIHTKETEVEEMKTKLLQPSGHRLVGQWQDTRTAKAAQKVQSLWRSVRAKKRYVKRVGEMDQEAAARRLQAAVRRRRQTRQPNALRAAAQEIPAARPITAERLFVHEEQILRKRREYIPDVTGDAAAMALRVEELRRKAAEKYSAFLSGMPRQRSEVARAHLQREQTRRMIRALEGRGWGAQDSPLPYGVCSAALLREAEEKHRERMASIAKDIWGGLSVQHTGTAIEAATVTVPSESRTEEAEADQLLKDLEADLGYDFSLERSGEPTASVGPTSAVVHQAGSVGNYSSQLR